MRVFTGHSTLVGVRSRVPLISYLYFLSCVHQFLFIEFGLFERWEVCSHIAVFFSVLLRGFLQNSMLNTRVVVI